MEEVDKTNPRYYTKLLEELRVLSKGLNEGIKEEETEKLSLFKQIDAL